MLVPGSRGVLLQGVSISGPVDGGEFDVMILSSTITDTVLTISIGKLVSPVEWDDSDAAPLGLEGLIGKYFIPFLLPGRALKFLQIARLKFVVNEVDKLSAEGIKAAGVSNDST